MNLEEIAKFLLSQINKNDFIETGLYLGTTKGIWLRKQYPKKNGFKPSFRQDGTPNDIAAVAIGLSPIEPGSELAGIAINVFHLRTWENDHFEYDFSNPLCPTQESVQVRNDSPAPVNFYSNNKYYFRVSDKSIIDASGKTISVQTLINRHLNKHFLSTSGIRKLYYRILFELFSESNTLRILDHLRWVLENVFGRKSDKDLLSVLSSGYKLKDFNAPAELNFDIFGFKTSKNVLVVFSIICLMAYALSRLVHFKSEYFFYVFNNPFLAIVHSVVFVFLINDVVPWILVWLCTKLVQLAAKRAWKKRVVDL